MPETQCRECGCPDRPWLRVKVVAQALGVCQHTVRGYIKAGTLKAVQYLLSGPWSVRHDSVHQLLDTHAAAIEPDGLPPDIADIRADAQDFVEQMPTDRAHERQDSRDRSGPAQPREVRAARRPRALLAAGGAAPAPAPDLPELGGHTAAPMSGEELQREIARVRASISAPKQ